jgi:hypothetical protein
VLPNGKKCENFGNFLSGYLIIFFEFSHLVIFTQFDFVLELSEGVRRVIGHRFQYPLAVFRL